MSIFMPSERVCPLRTNYVLGFVFTCAACYVSGPTSTRGPYLKSYWPAPGLQEGQLTARVSPLGLESSFVDV